MVITHDLGEVLVQSWPLCGGGVDIDLDGVEIVLCPGQDHLVGLGVHIDLEAGGTVSCLDLGQAGRMVDHGCESKLHWLFRQAEGELI